MSKSPKILLSKARLIDDTTPFAIKEAFNKLRTNLMYTAHSGCPVYGVTSAEAGVGKSTITANLAVAFAQSGKKTLLIDADMRRPAIYKYFGYNKKQNGLSELISGICSTDEGTVSTPIDNLGVITSGMIPPNPAELLLSELLPKLVEKWREEYDVIFIDMPPVGVVADALNVSELISGYVFVMMANKSKAQNVNSAIALIEQVGASITGLVINGTNPKEGSYGKNKYYQYGYYSTDVQ